MAQHILSGVQAQAKAVRNVEVLPHHDLIGAERPESGRPTSRAPHRSTRRHTLGETVEGLEL